MNSRDMFEHIQLVAGGLQVADKLFGRLHGFLHVDRQAQVLSHFARGQALTPERMPVTSSSVSTPRS